MLNLSHNALSKLTSEILHPNFGLVQSSLESLVLVDCQLDTPQAVKKGFLDNLEHMSGLYDLDLSSNKGISLSPLLEALNEKLEHLETL